MLIKWKREEEFNGNIPASSIYWLLLAIVGQSFSRSIKPMKQKNERVIIIAHEMNDITPDIIEEWDKEPL